MQFVSSTGYDSGIIDTLEAECELVSKAIGDLSEEGFRRPTRCPPWDVRVLLAHMWRDVDRIRVSLAERALIGADTNSVTYWRTYDPKIDGAAISDRAQEVAALFPRGSELAREFERNWREGIKAARREDLARVVVTWGPALRLDEFLATRVLEISVHGLDLADALGGEPWITAEGMAITRRILVGLLGGEPPGELGWDDLTFIETGTGRRRPSASERATLGPLAQRFPLLG